MANFKITGQGAAPRWPAVNRIIAIRDQIAAAWDSSAVFRATVLLAYLVVFGVGAGLIALLVPGWAMPVVEVLWVAGLAWFMAWLTVPVPEIP